MIGIGIPSSHNKMPLPITLSKSLVSIAKEPPAARWVPAGIESGLAALSGND